MTHNDEGQLTERMNSLAGELAGLEPKPAPGRDRQRAVAIESAQCIEGGG
jgi:hypothetical protein